MRRDFHGCTCRDIMQVELARFVQITGYANHKWPAWPSKGWPRLERSNYLGGVSHKKLWEMFPFRPDVANQQSILPLGESSAIVYSEQTSRACGTPVSPGCVLIPRLHAELQITRNVIHLPDGRG